MNKPTLYTPAPIGAVMLPRRVIRSATHEGCGEPSGNPSPQLAALYRKLVDGGIGALITGYAGVSAQGRTALNMPLFDSDERIEPFAQTIAYAKQCKVPVFLQIAHGGGMANARPDGVDCIAPSAYKYRLASVKARAMTAGEIEQTIQDFVKAIVRAHQAGYDGVQLHCAHGYLLSAFLSPKFNKRTDCWGGSVENRFRIIAEIISRARAQVGSFPILAKMSAYSNDKNNLTADDGVAVARLFEKSGCDAVEISCGALEDGFTTARCPRPPAKAFIHFNEKLKRAGAVQKLLVEAVMRLLVPSPRPLHDYNIASAHAIKKAIAIPVIVVGGLRLRRTMEEVVESGKADFVSLSRPLIIEPNLVKRFEDQKQDHSRCIDCCYCLIGSLVAPTKCYYGKIPRTV